MDGWISDGFYGLRFSVLGGVERMDLIDTWKMEKRKRKQIPFLSALGYELYEFHIF
jgi:hypothetical protein